MNSSALYSPHCDWSVVPLAAAATELLGLAEEEGRLLTEEEQTQLRGSVAGLNWAARQGRPDAASAASVIASTFPNPTVSDAKMANNTIARLKENDVPI